MKTYYWIIAIFILLSTVLVKQSLLPNFKQFQQNNQSITDSTGLNSAYKRAISINKKNHELLIEKAKPLNPFYTNWAHRLNDPLLTDHILSQLNRILNSNVISTLNNPVTVTDKFVNTDGTESPAKLDFCGNKTPVVVIKINTSTEFHRMYNVAGLIQKNFPLARLDNIEIRRSPVPGQNPSLDLTMYLPAFSFQEALFTTLPALQQ